MSTRSIIGTTDGITYEGIYCHFDGYPTGMVPALAKIIARDGAAALPVLTGEESRARGGQTATWDSINPEMPNPDTELPYPDRGTYLKNVAVEDADQGLMSLYTHLEMSRPDEDGRDSVIEGYGSVQTTHPLRFSGPLDKAEVPFDIEWVYLFTEDLTLLVFEGVDPIVEVERFTRDDLTALVAGDKAVEDRVELAECGKDYVRCSHVAWFHDDTAPDESKHLGMRQWIGAEPLHRDQAVAAIVGGTRYEVTGSSQVQNRTLSLFLKGGDALPVAKTNARGEPTRTLPGIELVYPPTKPEVEANA